MKKWDKQRLIGAIKYLGQIEAKNKVKQQYKHINDG